MLEIVVRAFVPRSTISTSTQRNWLTKSHYLYCTIRIVVIVSGLFTGNGNQMFILNTVFVVGHYTPLIDDDYNTPAVTISQDHVAVLHVVSAVGFSEHLALSGHSHPIPPVSVTVASNSYTVPTITENNLGACSHVGSNRVGCASLISRNSCNTASVCSLANAECCLAVNSISSSSCSSYVHVNGYVIVVTYIQHALTCLNVCVSAFNIH